MNGYRYLMKVPNNAEGWNIIQKIKYNLNRQSYKMRIRGSHLSDKRIIDLNPNISQVELKDLKRHRNRVGSMIPAYCDYLRVYIDERR